MRRLRREQRTDVALGYELPTLDRPWMTPAQRQAVADPLRRLQSPLDGGEDRPAIGAAKDLTEAACEIAIERSGGSPGNLDLPALFKLALPDELARTSELGRGLIATVQRLAELRNKVGAGHGHASLPEVSTATRC